MKIKVCGLKFLENIEAVMTLNPDWVGAIYYKQSPRYVGNVPVLITHSKIPRVGVFVHAELEEVVHIVGRDSLDYVQLSGGEGVSYCRSLQQYGIKIIKAFGVDETFDFEQVRPFLHCSDYFLFDTKCNEHGGSGRKFDWQQLKHFKHPKPFFLSGGITPADAPILKQLHWPYLEGVDINSGFEIAPGIKDLEQLKLFFQYLK